MSVQDRDYMKTNYRPQRKKFTFTGIHNKILFLLWLIKRRLLKPMVSVQKEKLNVPPHSRASESKSSTTSPQCSKR